MARKGSLVHPKKKWATTDDTTRAPHPPRGSPVICSHTSWFWSMGTVSPLRRTRHVQVPCRGARCSRAGQLTACLARVCLTPV